MSSTSTLPNNLDAILDLDKIKPLSPTEVEYLWISKTNAELPVSNAANNLAKQKVAAVIPAAKFQALEKLAHKNKQFILPVHNTETKQLEIHYIQWQVPPDEKDNTLQLLVIKLADYQRFGAQAAPHTIVYFYKNLQKEYTEKEESLSKGLVLMKGEIIDPKAITLAQLQFLILNVQKFYGVLDSSNTELKNQRLKLLLNFNAGDPTFDFNKLIEAAVNIQ